MWVTIAKHTPLNCAAIAMAIRSTDLTNSSKIHSECPEDADIRSRRCQKSVPLTLILAPLTLKRQDANGTAGATGRSRRRAISATSLLASESLSIFGSGCAPASSSSVTSFASLPSASCARFATISGSFLRRRLSSARRTTGSGLV